VNNTRRWGDNDRHIGPFTYARDKHYRSTTIILSSGEDEYPGCNLRLSALGRTLIIELPQIIQPYRRKVVAASWDEATVKRLGRNWYYDEHRREYGFSVSEGHLSVRLGRQTHDSSTTQDWGCFLPWTQWRFIRHSLYDIDGKSFWTELEKNRDRKNWRSALDAKDRCPSVSFAFDDFDGERITATTVIEEREWKFGTGYFKWLSLFRRPKISRSLDIRFSSETGKRKGSWKGGTVGHSIEMLPNELHEAAFRRYCAQHEMKFAGASA
jgi:hypothetical protein